MSTGVLHESNLQPAAFDCVDLSVEVSVKREMRKLLDGLTFSVQQGEIVSVIGTSGAGKTTLLRVLGGLMPATPESQVLAAGETINGPPSRVLMVFQDYGSSLFPWRTVRQNIALGLEEMKFKGAELRERVDEVISLVGLEHRADEYPWKLSGGMQQRVQIARALALRPSVLLMDEPFGALDAMTKRGLQDELLRLQQHSGATIVFITHDVEEAIYLGDKVLVLGSIPGRLQHILDVNLPRPRDQATTREDPEFLRLRHLAYEMVREAEVAPGSAAPEENLSGS